MSDAPPASAASPAPLWQASSHQLALSEMGAFRRRVNQRFKVKLKDYWQLHQWSLEYPQEFWSFLLEDSAIAYEGELEPAFRGHLPEVEWFENLRLNYAQGVLFPHGISPYEDAIIAITEAGDKRVLSYGQLREQVAACAEGLRQHGVEAGDRVAAYVANVPEAVVLLLACATVGAVFSSASPDFGAETAAARFGQITPTLLFASSHYYYNGKRYDCQEALQQLSEALPSLTRTVVIPYADEPLEDTGAMLLWDDFLVSGAELTFSMLPFSHPLYILYSSGTTGLPKAIVHRAGGAFLSHYKEQRLHSNIRKGDRVLYFTTCGWMMWNWLVSCLTQGCEIVLYEGSPAYPDLGHLWRLAGELELAFFGTSAGFLHACKAQDIVPAEIADLNALNTVASTGSPLSPEGFHWVYENVKADVHLASISGGTDIVSCFMLGVPTLPVYAGEIQAPGLGVDLAVYDETGEPLPTGEAGELVCRSPLPSMPLAFWNDAEQQRYLEAYFSHYPGVWRHGDRIARTEHGGVVVFGRSDATLNPGGVRIGTAEIYRPLESIPELLQTLAVGKTVDDDQEIWLFVVLVEGLELSSALQQQIRRTLREQASPRHVPRRIVAVPALPTTRSGKLSEIALTRVVNGQAVPNREALANPESLEAIAQRLQAPQGSELEPSDQPEPTAEQASSSQARKRRPELSTKRITKKLLEADKAHHSISSDATTPEQEATQASTLSKDTLEDSTEVAEELEGGSPRKDASKTLIKHLTQKSSLARSSEERPVTVSEEAPEATPSSEPAPSQATPQPSTATATPAKQPSKDAATLSAAETQQASEDAAASTERTPVGELETDWTPHPGQAFASALHKQHLHALRGVADSDTRSRASGDTRNGRD